MLLELQNIKKCFLTRKSLLSRRAGYLRAVDGVNLTIPKGENLGLVGESGCGKTTLARIILKLLSMDSGVIIFNGHNISKLSARRMRPYRQDLQMVFQDPYNSLDPRFTVEHIIQEGMIFDFESSRDEKREKMFELLKAVGLRTDISSRYPYEFSGGERQRIAIARALAMNPMLLILDEAVSSLDVLVQDQIIHLLYDLQKKYELTYLFISHNLRVVKKLSDKIAVMYKGKIVEWATAEDIFNNPIHPYTKELLAAALEYKTTRRGMDFDLKEGELLVDRGDGHFVMEE